jgi:hypothetical protein
MHILQTSGEHSKASVALQPLFFSAKHRQAGGGGWEALKTQCLPTSGGHSPPDYEGMQFVTPFCYG